MKFKVGDRVRIVSPASKHFKKEATVTGISLNGYVNRAEGLGFVRCKAYRVNVDGYGERTSGGLRMAFESRHLEPLVNPDEEAWQAFKSLHLKPALILAKEAA